MEIKDIINKAELTTDEMKFVVIRYIKERSSKDVDINVDSFAFHRGLFANEVKKLTVAYEIARAYYLNL